MMKKLLFLAATTAICSAAPMPNVIYILADDLGYGEVGYNGQEKIQTPELDAMAAAGMRFTDHYCGNAVCAASRASLMTGKHPGHAYIRANSPGYPNGQMPLLEGTETVGKLMQRAGYKTAVIGKWGLGSTWDSGSPNKQGFDHFFGYTDQVLAHNYYPEYLWRNSEKVMLDNGKGKENDYSHDLMTVEALDFIEGAKQEPFFLYLAYTIPHTAYQVPDLAQYADKDWPENMKKHAAMTSRMDRDIGTIKRRLEELGLAENTLIMFNSDNGAHGMSGSLAFFQTSGDLRGKKRQVYDGGVRSPMIAYWPGKVPAGSVSDHISSFWDMLPTMAELTGEPVAGETDGISMLPTLLGNDDQQQEHKYLYWELYEGSPNQAVRMGKWKGVVADRRKGMKIELYDITADEGEKSDVAAEYPEVVSEIRKALIEAHEPSPYWSKDNAPLFDTKAACEANGVEPAPAKPKKKKSK
ncbi:MAG: arylsulfatase [Luteolibacter sp.]